MTTGPSSIEEAGEVVLKGNPWVKCTTCDGHGFKSNPDAPRRTEELPLGTFQDSDDSEQPQSIPCWNCAGAGYRLNEYERRAYEMVGATLPEKPLTPRESVAKVAADFIKARLSAPSGGLLGRLASMGIVPQLIEEAAQDLAVALDDVTSKKT